MKKQEFKYLKYNILESDGMYIIANPNYITPFFDAIDIDKWIHNYNEAFDIFRFLDYYDDNEHLICPIRYDFEDINVNLKIYDKGLIQNHLILDYIKLDYPSDEIIDEKTMETWRLVCKDIIEKSNISLKENDKTEIRLLSGDFVIYLLNRIGIPDKEKDMFRKWIYLCIIPSEISR